MEMRSSVLLRIELGLDLTWLEQALSHGGTVVLAT
jgi:hypothetical protein